MFGNDHPNVRSTKGHRFTQGVVHLHHEKIHAEDCENCEAQEGRIDHIQRRIEVDRDLAPETRRRLIAIADRCPCIGHALDSTERWWVPEVHRLHGDLALATAASADQEAEHHFERALGTARAQQSRSLELRSATSLARLWSEHGDRQRACELLDPIYDWFSEGFETADLTDAKTLLDDLS